MSPDPSFGRYIWPRDLIDAMWVAGWRDADKLMRGAATVGLESNFYESIVGVNPDGSRDRGIWQINDRAHPKCTDAIAFDYQAATRWAFENIYKPAGYEYGAWAAYTRKLDPFLRGTSADPDVRAKVVYACEAVGNFLKQRYGVLA